ncbi:E3 ubiquitin-protein ligase rnf213-alpha-like [Mercenaria mercenaria]|uniref:E3 ubiquitin-protein ligase rnf213-alpha-like n=1 Tax=Mercenaria mercenaria TaxID=6596 RepID=UPI00234E92D5|nr:E3 ubiquitin-protein ligase rnf213-alpha-like [Mercenaria mercenaria]
METGKTVVLLNLENLYESLYDALNQYYVYFGGARYVDLGLGTHRVKCPVNENFRLIVVAEKQTVYKKFPIPLINRLEKHFLTINTMLTREQQDLVKTLEIWTKQFSQQICAPYKQRDNNELNTRVEDAFIGYHEDTCSSIILCICKKNENMKGDPDFGSKVLKEGKTVLLWSATPDSVLRLKHSNLPTEEKARLNDLYFKKQAHKSLMQYLNQFLFVKELRKQVFVQITTHSKLLTFGHKEQISMATGVHVDKILLLENLSSFDTEQQFSNKIRHHLAHVNKDASLMVIQCDSGDINVNLIACARYCVLDELEKMREDITAPVHVVFIVQLPRNARFSGFQCGVWHSVHIDALLPGDIKMPDLEDMIGRSPAKLCRDAVGNSFDIEQEIGKEREVPVQEEESEGLDISSISERSDAVTDCMQEKSNVGIDSQIHLDDVIIDFKNVDHDISEGTNRQLNMRALLMSCVQAALSIVKDKDDNSSRETDRVTLLLKLLHQDDEEARNKRTFLNGVCRFIVKMLEEKESATVTGISEDWIIVEAANVDNISKTGTLMRSCVQILESKVSPIFASLIAFLDTNSNLNLLEEVENTWKRELWLALLHTPESLNLQYADMRHRSQNEVMVMTTGYEGHIFSARMPFSWLLIKQITEVLRLKYPTEHGAGDNVANAESCFRVLSKQPFHVVFIEVIKDKNLEEVVGDYVHDFVHCVYNPGSQEEHQLVCQALAHAETQLATEACESNLLLTLINVHLAHDILAPRLTCFRAMNSVCPECSSTIVELRRKHPDHFMFQKYDLIFPAVCMLIEKLSPQKSELDQPQGRVDWLKRVYKYRPVVEKVICLQEDQHLYGPNSYQSLRKAKGLWSRVVVVKLFLEHVCTVDRKDKITIKYCMPLWTTLGEDTDMKKMKSFGMVERFLRSCNKGAFKEYLGAERKCSHCEQMLEGPPITLPCNDVLCDACYDDVKALGRYECTKCQEVIPVDFRYERQTLEGKAHDKLRDYQKRCNSFFMDIVSQLCFDENSVPSDEVIDQLLGYIFFKTFGQNQRTRDWTVFNTGIDPSPVFRSFLLQLLIRTSKGDISRNLETYLGRAKALINTDPEQDRHFTELSLLVIQCLEDMFNEQANLLNENETEFVIRSLRSARQTIEDPNITADKLYGLASARMGLAKAAKYIARIVADSTGPRAVPSNVRKVIEAAQILCEDTDIKWTRIYLVKYLCRCYGVDVYRSLCRSQAPFLRWIAIRDINIEKVVEVSDRYVVCGKSYITVREATAKVVLGETVEHLEEVINDLETAGVRVEPFFTLAVHREVTSSYLYPHQQRKLTKEVQEGLIQFIADCKALKNKTLLTSLVQNQLDPRHLRYVEGETLLEQGIQCIIVHFHSMLSHLNGDRTLIQPLVTMMTSPQECINCFLPTMPQDDLEDVKEALLAARNQITDADPNPVFYRCPNGHPYVIGNCGRAKERANCRECGAAIGGQGHRLVAGNTKDRSVDNTVKGHILGQAETRGRGPKPERLLTPTYCATIRCVLHLAMYVGSGQNLQGVQMLIKPDIEENQVQEFLWTHIQLDIDDIQKALNRSADDVLLFMHTIIDCILRTHNEGEYVRDDVWQWSSKRGRLKWETDFSNRFLKDILKNLEATIKTNSQLLAKDKRLGADPLLCVLYETDTQQEKENPAELQDIPRVWRYRTPISLQHLRQEVEANLTNEQDHKILQLFLEEEHHLRALRYIPSILRLHQALLFKYQKKIDKTEASKITVEILAQEQIAGIETDSLLKDVSNAWELVRNSLKMYLCPTELGGMAVEKEYCNMSINEKTPLSMLLPTEKEIGLCFYALLDFLMRRQNDFLDNYVKVMNREPSAMSKISPREVTSAHLISFDPQRDLIPLVLANCHYSFEMGKGTRIEYDFTGIERQLMDRFLFSKSTIDVGRVLEIDLMVYRTEITNAAVFKQLTDKIPQAGINAAEKTQICSDIRYLPDMCQSLDNLDIAIGFLKSTGGNQEQNLHEYMVKTLQMDFSVLSQKAQQVCQFQHVKSLWLLLSLQKAKNMTESDQHSTTIFENVSQEFHDDIPEELVKDFRDYTGKLTADKLMQLVEALHEFILLMVAAKQNTDEEATTDTTGNKLGEWLFGYIESLDSPCIDLAALKDFPVELLFKHCVKTWITLYKTLKMKESGAYRQF